MDRRLAEVLSNQCRVLNRTRLCVQGHCSLGCYSNWSSEGAFLAVRVRVQGRPVSAGCHPFVRALHTCGPARSLAVQHACADSLQKVCRSAPVPGSALEGGRATAASQQQRASYGGLSRCLQVLQISLPAVTLTECGDDCTTRSRTADLGFSADDGQDGTRTAAAHRPPATSSSAVSFALTSTLHCASRPRNGAAGRS